MLSHRLGSLRPPHSSVTSPAKRPLGEAVARVEITKGQLGFIGQARCGASLLNYQDSRHRCQVRWHGAHLASRDGNNMSCFEQFRWTIWTGASGSGSADVLRNLDTECLGRAVRAAARSQGA